MAPWKVMNRMKDMQKIRPNSPKSRRHLRWIFLLGCLGIAGGAWQARAQPGNAAQDLTGSIPPLPPASTPLVTPTLIVLRTPSLEDQVDMLFRQAFEKKDGASEEQSQQSGAPGLAAHRTPRPTPAPRDPSQIFVGIVNNRRLTKEELDRRARQTLAVEEIKPSDKEYEDAFIRAQGMLLRDWADRSLLAEEAHRRGIQLENAEFEAKYRELKNSPDRVRDFDQALAQWNLSEEDLRREIFDALLGAKLVDEETRKYNNDAHLRRAYERAPHLFYRPPQMHVLHYTQALTGLESKKELKEIRSRVDAIRKRIARGEDPTALAKEQGGPEAGALGMDLGWVSPSILSLPEEVQKQLQKMKTGQTSDIIMSKDDEAMPEGFHVLRVVEERPAVGATFESARPVLEDKLRMSIRLWLVDQIKRSKTHRVLLNTSGIPPALVERAANAPQDIPSQMPSPQPFVDPSLGPSLAPSSAPVDLDEDRPRNRGKNKRKIQRLRDLSTP